MELDPITNQLMEEAIHEALNPNSPTVLIQENNSRFSGAEWYNQITATNVILAGLGGIGSYVAFLLSRLNINSLTMYDSDLVDFSNMSGQLYNVDSINLYKTAAITNIIHSFSNYYKINSFHQNITSETANGPIMICGFDNMEARKIYFNLWKKFVDSLETKEDKALCLFIDGRLAAEELQVFCIQGDDTYNIENYMNNYLFTDKEAESEICSYKQTTFMANMIGSIMVNLFVNFVANQCEPLINRDLPFRTSYCADTMYFKTVN